MRRPHSYNLEPDLIEDIKKAAADSGLTASELVNRVMRSALDSRVQTLKELDSIDLIDLIRKVKKSLNVKSK